MSTKITTDINLAISHLRIGNLVAFPTETVYGLGADARNEEAIKKVFSAKGRPIDHPLIVHIAHQKYLPDWAINIPDSAWKLAEKFWPGPLTIILEKRADVSKLISGGQNTIALRVPNHRLSLAMLEKFNGGIVGPSANKYGRISPTTAEHVADELGEEVAVILDGGVCNVGIESTIIYLTKDDATIMREGMISADQIAAALGFKPKIKGLSAKPQTAGMRVSGNQESHYAPRTKLYLLDYKSLLLKVSKQSCVLSFHSKPPTLATEVYWIQASNNPAEYAHNLYATLRTLDHLNLEAILVERPENSSEWSAINDRLFRASFKQ